MDVGKYVAVGVLAVIVLAAATYRSTQKKGLQPEQATEQRFEGSYGGTAPTSTSSFSGPVDPLPTPETRPAPEEQPMNQVAVEEELIEYTVQKGQTLSDIALELLGDRGRWNDLYQRNKERIPNPDRIREGMKLVWTKVQDAKRAIRPEASKRPEATTLEASASRQPALGGGDLYVVAKGDTLYSIAKRKLGKGSRFQEIVTLNRLSSTQVRVGQQLRLPK